MVGRSACRLGLHPRETKPGQIEFFDENIDHSNGVVFDYVIFQAAGQKCVLRPFFRLHESTHRNVPHDRRAVRIPGQGDDTRPGKGVPRFYTAWTQSGPSITRRAASGCPLWLGWREPYSTNTMRRWKQGVTGSGTQRGSI